MASEQRTVRVDLSYEQLEAVSWAVWLAEPACPASYRDALAEADSKLLAKRRLFRTPAAAPELEPLQDPANVR